MHYNKKNEGLALTKAHIGNTGAEQKAVIPLKPLRSMIPAFSSVISRLRKSLTYY